MLSQKLQAALNDQIQAEYFSSYLYLAMAAHCQSLNLTGFAHWMRLQSKEEMDHALKIFDYLVDRRAAVELKAIDKPPTTWDSPVAIFEQTMKHEEMVTKRIDDLVNLAIADKDHATQAFLQWFVSEQVEEEARADAILQKVKAVSGSVGGLFMLDHHLGGRV